MAIKVDYADADGNLMSAETFKKYAAVTDYDKTNWEMVSSNKDGSEIWVYKKAVDANSSTEALFNNVEVYTGITEEMVREMRQLIRHADIITPNLTELFLLLDKPHQTSLSDAELKTYLKELSDAGPEIVIVTSVPVCDNPHMTSVYAYNRNGNRYWKVTCPYLPAHYPGTGDTFTSVITGALMQGDSLPIALDRATQFILQGIRATFGYEYNNLEGIMLEKVLPNLKMPIQISSYELVE